MKCAYHTISVIYDTACESGNHLSDKHFTVSYITLYTFLQCLRKLLIALLLKYICILLWWSHTCRNSSEPSNYIKQHDLVNIWTIWLFMCFGNVLIKHQVSERINMLEKMIILYRLIASYLLICGAVTYSLLY